MVTRIVAIAFLFLSTSIFTINDSQKLKIAIISVDDKEIGDAKKVKKYLESYYNCQVDILPAISTSEECYLNQSDTLLASKVLIHLDKTINMSLYDKYVALTEKAIYMSDHFPNIRGLGRYKGKSCLVSTHKIKKEAGSDKKLFRSFLKKVSRHEIGHTLGLEHCAHQIDCVMASGIVDTVFYNAQAILCDSCSNQVKPYLIRQK